MSRRRLLLETQELQVWLNIFNVSEMRNFGRTINEYFFWWCVDNPEEALDTLQTDVWNKITGYGKFPLKSIKTDSGVTGTEDQKMCGLLYNGGRKKFGTYTSSNAGGTATGITTWEGTSYLSSLPLTCYVFEIIRR